MCKKKKKKEKKEKEQYYITVTCQTNNIILLHFGIRQLRKDFANDIFKENSILFKFQNMKNILMRNVDTTSF